MIRLDRAVARTQEAISRVRQYEPNWRPTTQDATSPGRIEGAIRRAEARAAEAEARFERLRSGIGGNLGPSLEPPEPRPGTLEPSRPFDGPAWIDAYRVANNAPDLFGRPTWPFDKGTVAVTEIDGKLEFGVNARGLGYTDRDFEAALRWRDTLINNSPDVMNTIDPSRKPNDALFHAKSTVLIRAAAKGDVTLSGRSIEVHVDRDVCGSCFKVLTSRAGTWQSTCDLHRT